MTDKTLRKLELAGAFVCFLFWFLLYNFNEYKSGLLIKLLFSSANNSVWESFKLLLFAFVVWSGVELCWLKPDLRKFVVIKTIFLYLTALCYCILMPCLCISGFKLTLLIQSLGILITSFVYHFLTYSFITKNIYVKYLFIPCLIMLVAFVIMYVCFTPYPPKFAVFYDFSAGIYGIPSANIDKGAVFLDSLYGI